MQANPTTDSIKFSRNTKTGKMAFVSPLCLRTPKMYVPYGVRDGDGVLYLTLTDGTQDSDFYNYLGELDDFLKQKVESFNEKFGTNNEYIEMLKKPMKKGDNGELIYNEEAFEKHGFMIDVRMALNDQDRVRCKVDYEGKKSGDKTDYRDVIEFTDIVGAGTKVNVIASAGLWVNDKNEVRVMINAKRIKVHQGSAYDDVDYDDTELRGKEVQNDDYEEADI